MTVHVAFVGPLPPPVHGFSAACEVMLNRCRQLATTRVFNRTRQTPGLRGWLSQLVQPLDYFRSSRCQHGTVLYLALSGGNGQLFDALYILIARLLRQRIFVHHHSFAYIDHPTALNRALFGLLKKATHIVLSAGMGMRLRQLYGLGRSNMRVISNAALFPSVFVGEPGTAPSGPGPLRVGFLSNITFEKGIVEFFEVIRLLQARGVACEARIAGPVSAEVHPSFDQMLTATAHVQYLGPLYGEAKDKFYRELDVLLFPTRYVNEAEPLVIHEALRAGVFTIACSRGAIAEILVNGAGVAVPATEFVETAARWLTEASTEPAKLSAARQASRRQAASVQDAAVIELNHLLRSMCDA